MITILQESPLTLNVLGEQKVVKDLLYKKNPLCHIVPVDRGVLAYNVLTKELLFLSSKEYEIFKNGNDLSLIRRCLIKKWFLVSENLDLKLISQQINKICKSLYKSNEITKFIIMPTMDCNARCFYCFEKGRKKQSMKDVTAEDVAKYIVNISNCKEIDIQWFGGEPLYNAKAIDIIISKLKKQGITYKSVMISNGYLFNDDIIAKAKQEWNLKSVQITIDGTEKIYNRSKNYILNNSESPFITVMDNIKKLINSKIMVYIRINIGQHNIEDLNNLIEYISERFGKSKFISVYTWLLYDEKNINDKDKYIESRNLLNEARMKLEKKIYDYELKLVTPLSNEIKINYCIADSDNSITIFPDGSIGKCDHHSEDEFIGSIYSKDFNTRVIESWKECMDSIKLCDNCCLFPNCIKLTKCPDSGSYYCNQYDRDYKIFNLENQMKKTYELFCHKPVNIKLADFFIHINNNDSYLKLICDDFLTDVEHFDHVVNISEKQIQYENDISEESYSVGYLESICAYRNLSEWLPLHNSFLLHSAVFDIDGVGVAFAAHSGTGKTTHMLLWQKLLGEKMTIVNGDKPIVRFFDNKPDVPYAYGTPWNGKEQLGCNMRTPLKHICFIERSETNSAEAMQTDDVVDLIFNQVYMPKDPAAIMNTMQLINRVLSCCKLWKIKCNMESEAAEVAYKVIFG